MVSVTAAVSENVCGNDANSGARFKRQTPDMQGGRGHAIVLKNRYLRVKTYAIFFIVVLIDHVGVCCLFLENMA